MSGSRFHPYALEEGTNSDKSRKPPSRSISATATTSHQATSSQKVISHSTSSTIKNKRLPSENTKSVPVNRAIPTAPASCQAAFTPLSLSQAVTTPLTSRKAASIAVASQPEAFIPIASHPEASIPLASQPAASIPVASPLLKSSIPPSLRRDTSTLKVSSTPLGPSPATSTPLHVEPKGSGLAAYPYWSMAQNLFAMEHQQRIQLQQQWQQQLWLQPPNMAGASQVCLRGASQEYLRSISQDYLRGTSQEYLRSISQDYLRGTSQEYLRCISQDYLRGTSQEYLRYMNELRHMSVLPLIPSSPATLSYLSPMQDQPLNLSLKDKNSIPSSLSSPDVSSKPISPIDCFSPEKPKCSTEASPKASSPPSLKLHPTKPIQKGSLDPEVAKMFPHLRATDMGSIVLWNFLWALLADNKYKGIISWIDHPSLKFRVVHPLALAKLWGTVKKNKTMNWQKLMKVIDLYLSKNILKQGDDKLMFQFILVPQSPEVKTENDS